ncbi:MAG TPA: alpha/beta hydrolase-fold protein [Iamia sp.]
MVSRRDVLIGGGATAALAGIGALAVAEDWVPGSERLKRRFADTGPDGTIPDAPAGDVRLETRFSEARGTQVGLFTAVPDGHGTGEGLPVCLVLHGASATAADLEGFGLPRFLTAAVRDGVPPFVLVGTDGGRKMWRSSGPDDPDDPQRMLIEEVPGWLAERGFDWDRRAAWGWSMGGAGALLLGEAEGNALAAVAAFSPAVPDGPDGTADTDDGRPRDVWAATDRLAGTDIGLWCGSADPLFDRVQRFADALDPAPAVAEWARGDHTRGYWDRITPAAFAFIGDSLT